MFLLLNPVLRQATLYHLEEEADRLVSQPQTFAECVYLEAGVAWVNSVAFANPPAQAELLRRLLRPVLEPVGHALRVFAQGLIASQVGGVTLGPDHGTGHAEAKRAVARSTTRSRAGGGVRDGAAGVHFRTLGPVPSRKARTRALASGADWAMPASMDSEKKPLSALCSAMRGRPCISA